MIIAWSCCCVVVCCCCCCWRHHRYCCCYVLLPLPRLRYIYVLYIQKYTCPPICTHHMMFPSFKSTNKSTICFECYFYSLSRILPLYHRVRVYIFTWDWIKCDELFMCIGPRRMFNKTIENRRSTVWFGLACWNRCCCRFFFGSVTYRTSFTQSFSCSAFHSSLRICS